MILLVWFTAAARPIAVDVNRSLSVAVGVTVNMSCVTTSADPADWYHQTHDGDSPRLIYANYICLDRRYDVASSTGDCPALSRAEDQRNAAQGGVIFSYIFPGASTGGSGRNLRPNCAQGQENYTLKGENSFSFCSQKVKPC